MEVKKTEFKSTNQKQRKSKQKGQKNAKDTIAKTIGVRLGLSKAMKQQFLFRRIMSNF